MVRVVRLSDLSDGRLDVFARLTNNQMRGDLVSEGGVLVAESRMVVEVALEEGVEPLAFLVDERDLDSSLDLLSRVSDDVEAYVLPHEQIELLTGFRLTRGLLCAMRRPRSLTVGEALEGARRVVVVEDLVDVSNVGALFRNAAALGADAVILSPRCADPLSRRSVRVSMGCVFKLPWARAERRLRSRWSLAPSRSTTPPFSQATAARCSLAARVTASPAPRSMPATTRPSSRWRAALTP